MSVKLDHVGETNKSYIGLLMTIIEDNGANDLTIQFDDGKVVKHKRYCNFLKGTIQHPTINAHIKTNRVGQTKTLPDGTVLTVVAYRKRDDIDILRSDGTLIKHTSYRTFMRTTGSSKMKGKLAHIGEKSTASNGMEIEIVEYRTNKDIDVRFSDGYLVEHTTLSNFRAGNIGHPATYRKRPNQIQRHAESRIGEVNYNNSGMRMTLIAYRNRNDVDIQYDDGTIVEHKSYSEFKKGNIGYPGTHALVENTKKKYINKIFITSKGLNWRVTAYRSSNDLDVMCETGYVTTIHQASSLTDGHINHPFPYMVGCVSMNKFAYKYNQVGNFYCHCNKCGIQDIMTIAEMREHICQ